MRIMCRYLVFLLFGVVSFKCFSSGYGTSLSDKVCESGTNITIWFDIENATYSAQLNYTYNVTTVLLSSDVYLVSCTFQWPSLCEYSSAALRRGDTMQFYTADVIYFPATVIVYGNDLYVDCNISYITCVRNDIFSCPTPPVSTTALFSLSTILMTTETISTVPTTSQFINSTTTAPHIFTTPEIITTVKTTTTEIMTTTSQVMTSTTTSENSELRKSFSKYKLTIF